MDRQIDGWSSSVFGREAEASLNPKQAEKLRLREVELEGYFRDVQLKVPAHNTCHAQAKYMHAQAPYMHARTSPYMHARTHARTHARAHARAHALTP